MRQGGPRASLLEGSFDRSPSDSGAAVKLSHVGEYRPSFSINELLGYRAK